MSKQGACISTRRKVTMACENCRKRRIKCSGAVPCQSCIANNKQCKINHLGRNRRGPRPQARSGDETNHQRPISPSASIRPLLGIQDIDLGTSIGVGDDVFDAEPTDDESDNESDVPPMAQWHSHVERVLFANKSASSPADRTYLGLVCHLLELHWGRASVLLHRALPIASFTAALEAEICPRYLILAICACNVRYSVHILAQPKQSGDLGLYFERHARTDLLESPLGRDDHMASLQTYCFLAEFMISRGCGAKAWADIAVAESLVQLRCAVQQRVAKQVPSLDDIIEYLAVAKAIVCIGNPNLYSQPQTNTPNRHILPGHIASTRISERICTLLKIQELCRKPFIEHDPRPWTGTSEFCFFQRELDAFLMRWPVISPTEHLAVMKEPDNLRERELTVALLIAHCSVILLNRIFLPVPTKSKSAEVDQESALQCLDFPTAPDLFIKERISRCEASAAAICLLCKELIENHKFLSESFWIGFSVVQCALVMISRLHRDPKHPEEKVLESLKFAFTLVEALKYFLKPANGWIDMLFHVHDTKTFLVDEGFSVEDVFQAYFARFTGVEDNAPVPLDWEPIRAASPPVQESNTCESPRRDDEVTNLEETDADRSWIEVYTGQLDSATTLPDQIEEADRSNKRDTSERSATPRNRTWIQPMSIDAMEIDTSDILDLIYDKEMATLPIAAGPEGVALKFDSGCDYEGLQGFLDLFSPECLVQGMAEGE